MFAEMIHALSKGRKPPSAELKRRLDLAIVKKGGVFQQPKMCWSSDTKINPTSKHMLWAAVILEDTEGMSTITGMIEIELSVSNDGKGLNNHLLESLNELAELPADLELKDWLTGKINNASCQLGLNNRC